MNFATKEVKSQKIILEFNLKREDNVRIASRESEIVACAIHVLNLTSKPHGVIIHHYKLSLYSN